jgi:hypothetical protein
MNHRKRDFPKLIDIKEDADPYELQWRRDMGMHEGEIVLGECSASGTIELRQGRDIKETYETMAHELLHAIEFAYDIDIPHELIYKLQKPLGYLLRRNFCWIKWENAS